MIRGVRLCAMAVALGLAAAAGGCMVEKARYDKAQSELESARKEARRLKQANRLLRSASAAQRRQIESLQALGGKGRLDKLFQVKKIALGRQTGGVDTDNRPGDDAVKVYLRPVDQHGHVIKAPGDVTIQLYDLAAPVGRNLIARRRWKVETISKHWYGGFLVHHYSFLCPWKSAAPGHEEVTVRVEFVDYLTGRRLTAQKLCKVKLPPPPATRPAK